VEDLRMVHPAGGELALQQVDRPVLADNVVHRVPI
jgi:hypothetical protein